MNNQINGYTRTLSVPVLLFILIPFFLPTSITNGYLLPNSDIYYKAWKLLSSLIIVLLAVTRNIKVIPIHFVVYFLLFAEITISTYINHGMMSEQVNLSLSWLTCYIAIKLLLDISARKTIDMIINIYLLLLALNLVSIFTSPNAMYLSETGMKNWFLGDRNVLISYCMPATCISVVRDKLFSNKISKKSICISLMSIIEIFIVRSMTSLVVYSALLILMAILLLIKHFPKWYDLRLYVFATVAVLFVIIVLQNQYRLISFVAQKLGKDDTFTGRAYIWKDAIDNFMQNSVLGLGLQERVTSLPIWNGEFIVSHAHNLILQILNLGGIIGLLLASMWFVWLMHSVDTCPDKAIKGVLVSCMGLTLIGLCFDYYSNTSFACFLCFSAFIPSMIGKQSQGLAKTVQDI